MLQLLTGGGQQLNSPGNSNSMSTQFGQSGQSQFGFGQQPQQRRPLDDLLQLLSSSNSGSGAAFSNDGMSSFSQPMMNNGFQPNAMRSMGSGSGFNNGMGGMFPRPS